MNCRRGRLLVFLLANSWVGQNSGSIELYFIFYFRMDCGWVTGSAEANNRRKKEDRAKYPRPDRSEPLSDRSDSKCAPIKWAIRSIGCTVRSIGQAAQVRDSLQVSARNCFLLRLVFPMLVLLVH